MESSSTESCLANILIAGKYQLGAKLGSGSFGEVFVGTDTKTGKEVAMKVEKNILNRNYLVHEREVYSTLQGQTGIPHLFWFGTQGDFNAIVIEKLGPSLHNKFTEQGKKFSLKTVLMIADQMLTCMEGMHNRGYIHRDISPSNICIGPDGNRGQLFLIDFGLAFNFVNPISGEHCTPAMTKKYITFTPYSSTRNEHRFQQTRRDDVESLAYVLIYFLRGHLPWKGIKGVDNEDTRRLRRNLKKDMTYNEIAEDCPAEFAEYLFYCRNLGFSDKPNYDYIRKLFSDLFDMKQYIRDKKFDWDYVISSTACNAAEVQN